MKLPRHASAHLRETLRVSAQRAELAAGLRAATATILPLVAAELLHRQAFTSMALGGWLAGFADPGGPYRARAQALLEFILVGSSAYVLGTLVGRFPAAGVLALFVVAFGASFARVLGASIGTIGNLSLLVFCIAAGAPADSVHTALMRGGLLAAGALGAAFLALALWPIHAYGPAREAVAEALRALADCARAVAEAAQSGDEKAWSKTLVARPKVRAALELARTALAEVHERRLRETPRAAALVSLVERAELSYGVLIALAEVLQSCAERGSPDLAAGARLHALAGLIDEAAKIPQGAAEPPAHLEASSAAAGDAAVLLERLAGHVRALLDQRAPLQLAGAPAFQPAAPPPLIALRSAFSWESLELRYALRMATAVAAGALVAHLLDLHRQYWVTVTIVIVLQPHAGATLRKGLSRVAGTMLGATAAALLAPLLHRPLVTVLVLFALAVAAIALRKKSYALYGLFVTPLFVLLAESSAAGGAHLVQVRIIDTLVGGAVAILAAYLMWPVWERDRVFAYIGSSLERSRDYLQAVFGNQGTHERQAARRALGLAHGNAEASFERFLAEPHELAQIEPMMVTLSQARRLGAASVGLSVLRAGDVSQVPAQVSARLTAALDELAASARERRVPAELGDLRALLPAEGPWRELLERVVRPIELLRSALARLNQPAPR